MAGEEQCQVLRLHSVFAFRQRMLPQADCYRDATAHRLRRQTAQKLKQNG